MCSAQYHAGCVEFDDHCCVFCSGEDNKHFFYLKNYRSNCWMNAGLQLLNRVSILKSYYSTETPATAEPLSADLSDVIVMNTFDVKCAKLMNSFFSITIVGTFHK